MLKLTSDQSKVASSVLERMDKIAGHIQAKAEEWGIPFDEARKLVNAFDQLADDTEAFLFGKESFERRQVELLKEAKVFQSDADEPYMQSFQNDTVYQQDADEPYMSAYSGDDSSEVRSGQDVTGDPLTPHS